MATRRFAEFASAVFLVTQIFTPLVHADCELNITRDLGQYSPLFLDSKLAIVYPTKESPQIMNFHWFEDRLLYCVDKQSANPRSLVQVTTAQNPVDLPLVQLQNHWVPPVVRCLEGQDFLLRHPADPVLKINQFSCTPNNEKDESAHHHVRIAMRNSNKQCAPFGNEFHLGFYINPVHFVTTVAVCYDHQLATTIWAYSLIPGATERGRQTLRDEKGNTVGRSVFAKGDGVLEGVTVTGLYSCIKEIEALKRLMFHKVNKDSLGKPYPDEMSIPAAERERMNQQLEEMAAKYIRASDVTEIVNGVSVTKKRNMFERGHLVARGDKFYFAEQESTYFLINVLPMWGSINRGNWAHMEEKVRQLAERKGNLHTWTGGLGVLVLEDVEVYLGVKKSRNKNEKGVVQVPAPFLLYKLVYSPDTREAAAFLAINNPYVTLQDIDLFSYYFVICQNPHPVCRTKAYDDTWSGYMYCCTYQDFMSARGVGDLHLPVQEIPADVGWLLG